MSEDTETPTVKLTNAQYNEDKVLEIEAKQKELEEKFKCQIFPIAFRTENGGKIEATGYMKKPSISLQMSYSDMLVRSTSTANETLMELCIIKEESDPRLYTKVDENSEFYLGALYAAEAMVVGLSNAFKKK